MLFLVGRGLEEPAVEAWRTVCLSIAVQALPFLLLGTALSGAINAFVPAKAFSRLLPRNPALAVPVAGAAGVVLPGCECASVPVANSLIRRGVDPAAAFAFLLSAPAVNPITFAPPIHPAGATLSTLARTAWCRSVPASRSMQSESSIWKVRTPFDSASAARLQVLLEL